MPVVYTGPRFHIPSGSAEALVVEADRIVFAGTLADAVAAAGTGAVIEQLGGALALPAFVDAHTHLADFGDSLGQVDLVAAKSLDDILDALRTVPPGGRLLGRSWLFDALPRLPDRQMLDADFPDRPVYLTANDLHSVWLNSAALAEAGITDDTPDPIGGEIVRDADGHATGFLLETAAHIHAWEVLADAASDSDRDQRMAAAIAAYSAAGVGSVVDMMMTARDWATLQRLRARLGGVLPLRVAAHWAVIRTGDAASELAAVAEAARLAREESTPDLAVIGIKIVADGVIDACTATMRQPYANGTNADPIWPLDALIPVAIAADAAGLSIAIHAIGDGASDIALDALDAAATANGPRPRRHRIEHLETVAVENVERMARAGVTASMQPVHTDPAILANWVAMLGDDRADRGFPWREFERAGALLAFGTDAPTAPHSALHNLYIAVTRASALDPALPSVRPEDAVSFDAAVAHATADAARATGWDDAGILAPGMRADFTVLDVDPEAEGPASLLTARILRTVVGGRTVFEA